MYKIKNTPYILCSTAKVGDYKKKASKQAIKARKKIGG